MCSRGDRNKGFEGMPLSAWRGAIDKAKFEAKGLIGSDIISLKGVKYLSLKQMSLERLRLLKNAGTGKRGREHL